MNHIAPLVGADRAALDAFVRALDADDRRRFDFLDRLRFEELLDPARFAAVLLARDPSGAVAAYGHLERFAHEAKRHVARLGIAVHPSGRGTGLSSRMMEALLSEASRAGFTKVWLSVHRDNTRAVRLYEKHGFVTEGLFTGEEIRDGRPVDVLSMARRLDAPAATEIPWSRPSLGADEAAAVLDVLRSGWFTQGAATKEFERRLAEHLGARHVVAMDNGTSCLVALFALLFQKGDRVLFPAFTFISTLNSALVSGIEPVLVDVEAETGNIDLAAAEAILARDRSIRGLVTVDIAGLAVDPQRCRELADRFGIALVEDAAEALGAMCRGGRVGGFGHPTMFSFHAAKLLTTIEGGAVAVNDDGLAARLRAFRNHGESARTKFVWDSFGLNLRTTDLQAAIGLAQLGKLGRFVRRRGEIVRIYRDGLAGRADFQRVPDYVDLHPYMMCLVKFESEARRTAAAAALSRRGIFSRAAWAPLHRQPATRALFPRASLPVSEAWQERGLCLPIYNDMTDADAGRVVAALRESA